MFTIKLYSDGLLRRTIESVPAYKHANMWRLPDFAALAPHLTDTVRQALQRATWEYGASDLLQAKLTDKRGRDIGSITAQWGAF